MNSTEVLILGGGPAGLSLSLFLRDLKIDSHVIEKSDSAGGLARSIRMGGYTFDHSGHLLHTGKQEVLDLVQKRLKVRLDRVERKSVCWVEGKFVPFPYQQNLFYLKPQTCRDALLGFFKRRQAGPANFKEWIHASYGDGVGGQFLYPYNEKLWNVDLRQMSVDWVPRFLPSSGSKEILKSVFHRQKESWGYNAVFYYPTHGGIGTIGDRLAATVRGQTTVRARIRKIDIERRIVHLDDGNSWRYRRLVSTIPLPEFLRLSGGRPSGLLRSTGVTVFNVGIRERFPFDFHWCYVPSSSLPFYRFGVYSNISKRAAPPGRSCLYIECAAPPEKLAQFRFASIRSHFVRLGWLSRPEQIEMVQRLDLRYAYPVPFLGLARYRDSLQRKLRGRGVELLGRFGAWRYVAISDVIIEAGVLARRLALEFR